MSERQQLGALLVAGGLLTREALDAALLEQASSGKSLGRILIDNNLVTESDLVATLAAQIGLEYVDLSEATVDPAATVLITPALARRYQALPIGWDDGKLVVAMADPSNVFAIDDIRTITGAEVKTVVATRAGIGDAIDKHHRLDSDAENITAQAASEFEDEDDLSSIREVVEDAPIVKLVNVLITQAVQDRASDIHTGPTGSGKSTTLYATLNILNDESKNVITVEDPVEYRLPNINQVQVNQKAGLTFAAALRSILRSDPDIVLVGEIRDRETATIAIEAALTGHLVLSTLHTNDAATTPQRLVEMGVEPFLVGSAIDCIVAQRLARRLCDKCKEGYTPEEPELRAMGWYELDPDSGLALDEVPTLFRPVGCGSCGKTGYHGRFALHEVLNVTEEVERVIVERGHSEDLKKIALAQGMLTLRQAGVIQVANGLTSMEEVLRVVA